VDLEISSRSYYPLPPQISFPRHISFSLTILFLPKLLFLGTFLFLLLSSSSPNFFSSAHFFFSYYPLLRRTSFPGRVCLSPDYPLSPLPSGPPSSPERSTPCRRGRPKSIVFFLRLFFFRFFQMGRQIYTCNTSQTRVLHFRIPLSR
jgi:hypothetical protein